MMNQLKSQWANLLIGAGAAADGYRVWVTQPKKYSGLLRKDEIQLYYDLLNINRISSSWASRTKDLNRLEVAPGL